MFERKATMYSRSVWKSAGCKLFSAREDGACLPGARPRSLDGRRKCSGACNPPSASPGPPDAMDLFRNDATFADPTERARDGSRVGGRGKRSILHRRK